MATGIVDEHRIMTTAPMHPLTICCIVAEKPAVLSGAYPRVGAAVTTCLSMWGRMGQTWTLSVVKRWWRRPALSWTRTRWTGGTAPRITTAPAWTRCSCVSWGCAPILQMCSGMTLSALFRWWLTTLLCFVDVLCLSDKPRDFLLVFGLVLVQSNNQATSVWVAEEVVLRMM